MKVQELRNLLKSVDKLTLEKMCVELYKQIPRQKKETDIDPLLTDMAANQGTIAKKPSKPVNAPVDITVLKSEIDTFLENAYAQNYFAPNRVISKKERPKWRFIVKRYIKELEGIKPDDEDYAASGQLLKKLFNVLSYACSYYLFSTENPFNSVGISQLYLYNMVLERVFSSGYTQSNIKEMLSTVTSCGIDPEVWRIQLLAVFVDALRSKEALELALKCTHELVAEIGIPAKSKKNRSYKISSQIEYLCDIALWLGQALGSLETEIDFYCKVLQCERTDAFVTVLDFMECTDNNGMWLSFYEQASKACELPPRLQKSYNYLKGESYDNIH